MGLGATPCMGVAMPISLCMLIIIAYCGFVRVFSDDWADVAGHLGALRVGCVFDGFPVGVRPVVDVYDHQVGGVAVVAIGGEVGG